MTMERKANPLGYGLCGLVLNSLVWASEVQAAPTFFTDEPSFQTAVAGGTLITESFETPFADAPVITLPGFTATAGGGVPDILFLGASVVATDGISAIGIVDPSGFGIPQITFQFDSPINAFGIDVVDALDFGGGGTLTLSNENGDAGVCLSGRHPNNAVAFCGIIDDMATFSTLTITGTLGGDGIVFDRLQFGRLGGTCVQPPSGLISWWDGDGDASDIQDGNDGTLEGGVTFAPGKVTEAFSFGAGLDRIKVNDAPPLDITGTLSIDAWIRTTDTDACLVRKVFVYEICVAGGKLAALLGNGSMWFGAADARFGTSFINDGQFHHVALTYHDATDTLRLYVDGSLELEDTNYFVSLGSNNENLYFGVESNVGDTFLSTANLDNGLLDEVEIFNEELTASQIQTIFLAGSAGKCKVQGPAPPSIPNLVDTSDSGSSNTDNITNDTTPTFGGTAAPASTVELSADGISLGMTAADAAGAWRLTTLLTEGTYALTATATDAIGNVSDPSPALIVTIDTTEPTIMATRTPDANANGWNNTDVTVSFACADALSGLAGNPPAPTTVATEGAHQAVTGSCEDVAGNTAELTIEVNIDKTAPRIFGLPAPGCTLWPPNHKLVWVATVVPSDGLSGLAAESLAAVSSEPQTGRGDGHTHRDVVIISGTSVKLRAERSGFGNGRVYTITASASDLADNATLATATCDVPHDQGRAKKKATRKKPSRRK